MNRTIFLFCILLVLGHTACVPPSNEVLTEINFTFDDPTFQRIHDLQDQQLSDSLYPYFRAADPTWRYLSALAFASIQDTAAIDSLSLLLQDPIDDVRAAAAYALGQTGSNAAEKILIGAFEQEDTMGTFEKSNSAILEAIGKAGSKAYLTALATISTYQPTDVLLLSGQVRGIYRYALRNITNPTATAKMVDFATDPNFPFYVRLMGAHYLARAQQIDLTDHATALIRATQNAADPKLRMALVIALGKTKDAVALEHLRQLFATEADYRVKSNILRVLGNFSYEEVVSLAQTALQDPNPHVSYRASQYFVEQGRPEAASIYWRIAKDSLHWQSQISLYQAANRHMPPYFQENRNILNAELRRRFARSTSPYEKVAILKALAEFGWNLRFIQREGASATSSIVKTGSIEALAAISDRPDFATHFGSSRRTMLRELSIYFKDAIVGGDLGMMTTAAIALRHPSHNYPALLEDHSFLQEAIASLDQPETLEEKSELQKTINFFAGKPEGTHRLPDYNHPIDWTVIEDLTPGDSLTATLTMASGQTIPFRLLLRQAPGTVINFVQLASSGYYNNTAFHRVVPNFVVQGGSTIGDGFGGVDYTIRSELPPLYYDAGGYVGMASIGNHTESAQFFITHSPTPHLDGNYTIFGKVAPEDMDAVHQILLGDTIQQVKISP